MITNIVKKLGKWVNFDPKSGKNRPFLTKFGPILDPGPAHGSGSDFGPGYPGLRPGSGRSTNDALNSPIYNDLNSEFVNVHKSYYLKL